MQNNWYDLINSNYSYAFQKSLVFLRRQSLYPAQLRKLGVFKLVAPRASRRDEISPYYDRTMDRPPK